MSCGDSGPTLIRRDAGYLYNRLKAGEKYDDAKWHQWENVRDHWEQTMQEWLSTATFFGRNIQARTLTVDDREYGREWDVSEAQFSNAEAVRRFKKFRIVQRQWEQIVQEVDGGLHQVAFNGKTQQEVRNGERPG